LNYTGEVSIYYIIYFSQNLL